MLSKVASGAFLMDDEQLLVDEINSKVLTEVAPGDEALGQDKVKFQHIECFNNFLTDVDWSVVLSDAAFKAKLLCLAKRLLKLGVFYPAEKT